MQTANYSLFKNFDFNRDLQTATNLRKSMTRFGFLKSKPITVNSDFEVIDGKHRLEVAKELSLPIYYEIDEVPAKEAMIAINTSQNTWRLYDYVHFYAQNGVKCYKEMYELHKHNTLNISDLISVYTGLTGGTARQIRKGHEFKKFEHYDLCMELLSFFKSAVSFRLNTTFTRGVIGFLKQEKLQEKHILNLKKNAFSIVECAKVEQYLAQFNKLSKYKTNG